jgi:hypothetical protein
MRRALALAALLAVAVIPVLAPAPSADDLLARAKALELNTPYVPPPGDPMEHHASGYAKVICSAVFITGLSPEFAIENVGFFTAPGSARAVLGKPVIDRAARAVHVALPSGVKRTALYLGDQGCVTLPIGKDSVAFKPVRVRSRRPDPSTRPWPIPSHDLVVARLGHCRGGGPGTDSLARALALLMQAVPKR